MAPSSARSLAVANIRKAILAAQDADQPPDPFALEPGHIRLYTYYKPSLGPGLYGIEAKQTIKSSNIQGQSDATLTVFNYESSQATNLPSDPDNPNAPVLLQQFRVIAPQFSLDPKLVNSVYPPPGHADEGSVLPHIVLNDPHMPWDRTIWVNTDGIQFNLPVRSRDPTDPSFAGARLFRPTEGLEASTVPGSSLTNHAVNRGFPYMMPWVGLVVFNVDELALTASEEAAYGLPRNSAPSAPASGGPAQLGSSNSQVSSPGAYQMKVSDYLTKISTRINYDAVYSQDQTGLAELKTSSEATSIIFPKKQLASQVFQPAAQFLHLSHVRETDTAGLPDAGADARALFSICISRRTGPVSYAGLPKPIPITQVVHLISLEGVDYTDMTSGDLNERIGMVSLYNWTYLAVPPDPVNFLDVMRNLGNTMQMLKAPQKALDDLEASESSQPTQDLKDAAHHLHDRLAKGYTVSRWRTSTGEETVSFTRGPLTPLPTPWKPAMNESWPASSNTGKDYQILDSKLGLMDMTYSSAWQLGKLLAIADKRFNAALLRFRSLVHEAAASTTRLQVNSIEPRETLLRRSERAISRLEDAEREDQVPSRLVLTPEHSSQPRSLRHPSIASTFSRNLNSIIEAQVSSGEDFYRGFGLGKSNNSDWEIIHNWISDKLFLSGIPAQYLFPDPSYLPSESLRFFFIDDAWLDCLIDGALSVANHLEPVDDKVRRRIKEVYNVHLANNVDPAPVKPPVPRYGFIVRSQLIKAMPDMKITVVCRKLNGFPPNTSTVDDENRRPLVRLTRLDDFTIFALLDCVPEEVSRIMFIQPPHQQRFVAAAAGLDAPEPDFELIQLYNANAPQSSNWPAVSPPSRYPSRADMNGWYDSSSRCLDTIKMARDIVPSLVTADSGNGGFGPSYADSVILSLELNDPSFQLTVLPPHNSEPPLLTRTSRQLWIGKEPLDLENLQGRKEGFSPTGTSTRDAARLLKPGFPRRLERDSRVTVHPTSSIRQSQSLDITKSRSTSRPVGKMAIAPPLAHRHGNPSGLAITETVYQVAVHPAYRTSSPPPITHADGTRLYSSTDFLPTHTSKDFDIILTLWLKEVPHIPVTYSRLVSITIDLPCSVTSEEAQGEVFEPLLQLSNLKTGFPGVQVIHNKRLISYTSLYQEALGSSSGQHRTYFSIELMPRTSTDTAIPLGLVKNIGLQISGAKVTPIQDPLELRISGGPDGEKRGLSQGRITETFNLRDGTTTQIRDHFDIVKREGGDVDASGRLV